MKPEIGYPPDFQVLKGRFILDEIISCDFKRKELVRASKEGFPCATCSNETFIPKKIHHHHEIPLFLCNSCHAPMCFSCFVDSQKFAKLRKEKLCQYCAQKAHPCHRLDFNDGNEKEYEKVFQANVACYYHLMQFRKRINLRNPKFDYSKLIWAKQVNQNWRKLLELEQLFAHQHPEQIRILVTGMSPLPQRIAYRLPQEYFWGFYPQLRVKSLTFSMTKFIMRPSKHCLKTWFFCVVIERRVRAGCANHFANLLGEVDFMKAP